MVGRRKILRLYKFLESIKFIIDFPINQINKGTANIAVPFYLLAMKTEFSENQLIGILFKLAS
jgi:hypothetical protein